MKKEFQVIGLHVNVLKIKAPSPLRWMFRDGELEGLLEDKDFKYTDMVFLFTVGYIKSMTGYGNGPMLRRIYTLYSNLFGDFCSDKR